MDTFCFFLISYWVYSKLKKKFGIHRKGGEEGVAVSVGEQRRRFFLKWTVAGLFDIRERAVSSAYPAKEV